MSAPNPFDKFDSAESNSFDQFDEADNPFDQFDEKQGTLESAGKGLVRGAGAVLEMHGQFLRKRGFEELAGPAETSVDEARQSLEAPIPGLGTPSHGPEELPIHPVTGMPMPKSNSPYQLKAGAADEMVKRDVAPGEAEALAEKKTLEAREKWAEKLVNETPRQKKQRLKLGKYLLEEGGKEVDAAKAFQKKWKAEDYYEAKKFTDNLQDEPVKTVLTTIAEQAPNIGVSLVAALATRGMGRVIQVGAMGGTSYVLEGGDIFSEGADYLEKKYDGYDKVPDKEWAKLVELTNKHALINAGLDTLLPAKLTGPAKRQVVEKLLSKEGLKKVSKEAIEGALTELPTEIIQETAPITVAEELGKEYTPGEKMQRYAQVGVAGGGIGFSSGAVKGAADVLAKKKAKQETKESPPEEPQKPETTLADIANASEEELDAMVDEYLNEEENSEELSQQVADLEDSLSTEEGLTPSEKPPLNQEVTEDDRRADPEKRSRVESLKQRLGSLEERYAAGEVSPALLKDLMETSKTLHSELTTSAKTGMLNENAFKDFIKENPDTTVLYDDLDDFKSYNTKYQHKGVDEYVLPHIGKIKQEAAKAAGVTAFHRSGDEFLATGTPEQLEEYGRNVQEQLANTVFEIKLQDGLIVEHTGVGLSYGIGQDESTAESAADIQKEQRKTAGLRTGQRDVVPVSEPESGRGSDRSEAAEVRPSEPGVQGLDEQPGQLPDAAKNTAKDGVRSQKDETDTGPESAGDISGNAQQAAADLISDLDEGLAETAPKKPPLPKRKPKKFTAKQASDKGYIESVGQIKEFNSLLEQAHDQGIEFNGETLSELREAVKGKFNPASPDIKFSKTSASPFFSQLSKVASDLKQEKGTAQQFLSMIKKQPGVKAEELEWTGLEEYLTAKGNEKITKQEIVDFLDANGVQVETVVKDNGISEEFMVENGDKNPVDFEDDLISMSEWVEKQGYDSVDSIAVRDDRGNGSSFSRNFDADDISKARVSSEPVYDKDDVTVWAVEIAEENYFITSDNAETALIDYSGELSLSELLQDRYSTFGEEVSEENKTKFSEWQLPGAENYREVLLTLPVIQRQKLPEGYSVQSIQGGGYTLVGPDGTGTKLDSDSKADAEAEAIKKTNEKPDEYRVPDAHAYGEERSDVNRLAHIRVNDRTDADGNKVLFVEEIQSDWHQAGRKKGYKGKAPVKYKVSSAGLPMGKMMDFTQDEFDTEAEAKAEVARREEVGGYHSYIPLDGPMVPDAPFKNNAWAELSIKRVLRMAAEGGYDSVAWTTGEQQAERYDLSKQVDSIGYRKDGDDTYEISAIKDGESVMVEHSKTAKQLEEIVGKEVAKKIVDGEGVPRKGGGNVKDLSGVDLKVGGEGMKGFYDRTLPNLFKKVAGKLDKSARVGESRFDGGTFRGTSLDFDSWSIPVTAKMREGAMAGQPLFRKTDSSKASQSTTKPIGMPKARVQEIAEDFLKGLTLSQEINLTVSDKQDDIFGKQSREKGIIKGAIHDNQLAIVAENMNGSSDVERTMRHEILAHYGAKTIPETWNEVSAKIIAGRNSNALKKHWAAVDQYYPEATEEVKAEEVFAKAIQDPVTRLSKIITEIMAMIQEGLRKVGLIKSPVTKSELKVLAESIAEGIKRGRRAGKVDPVAYSKKMEAAETQSAKDKGLPMDKESRLARAREMGFDTDTVYYHGTTQDYDQVDLDRYAEGEGGQGFGFGHHVSLTRDTADSYSAVHDKKSGGTGKVNEYFLPLKFKDLSLDWHAPLNKQSPDIINILKENNIYKQNQTGEELYYDIASTFDDEFGGDKGASEFLSSLGVLGLRYFDTEAAARNIDPNETWFGEPGMDEAMREGNYYNYTIFDPKNIRSTNAAFDPDFKDSPNILYQKSMEDGQQRFSQERLPTERIYRDDMIERGASGHLDVAYERYIPIDKLIGLEPTPKADTESGEYEAGREITTPIEAVYDPDADEYTVFAGNHRIAQAKANAQKYILAFVESPDGKRIKSGKTINPDAKPSEPSGEQRFSKEAKPTQTDTPAFDPNNPNILYSKSEGFSDWVLPNAMAGHFSGLMGKKEKLAVATRRARRKLQDKFIVWKDVQRAIEKMGGKLTDFSDAYNKFTLIEGKIGDKFKTLFDDHIKPLVDEISKSGVTIEQLGEYMYAQFAPQRNARIAEINSEMPDGGSGLTNQEAKDIISKFTVPQKAQLERLAQKVYAMQKYKLDVLVDSGRMTSELRDDLLKDDRYVPLKGFADASDLISDTEGTGRGFDQARDIFKRAKGRKSLAAEIVSTSVRDVENAIISAEKNRAGQAVLKLAMDNPNNNLWKVNPVKIQKVFNKSSGQVEQRVITSHKQLAMDPNVFVTWVKGKPYAIEFRDNPNGESSLARAVKNMSVDSIPWYVSYLAAYNRWLSMANTALSPEFLLTNPIRDVQTALAKAYGDYDAKIAGNVAKNLPKAIKGAIGGIGESKLSKKIGGSNPKWSDYFKEYSAEGGKTDYFRTKTVDEMKGELEAELAAAAKGTKGSAIRVFRAVKNTIENGNAILENMTRLSMYGTLREAGYSKHEAAVASKNLTVNFNRKGESGALINSLFLFYNASMQGAHLTLKLMKNPKVQKLMVAAGAGVVLLTQYNILMGGDDDDGEANYFKIPDYEKERNLIIMWPDGSGKYSKIPLPYGLNVPLNAAASIAHTVNGADPMEQALWVGSSAWNSFSPVGENGWNIIAPTILDPFVDINLNRNYADRKIMPEKNPYEKAPTPDSQRAFSSTNPGYKKVSEKLNELTGGDEQKPGGVDISPESIEHLVDTLTGAAGGFVNRIITWMSSPEEMETARLPFVRKFYGEKSPYTVGQTFRENKKNVYYLGERKTFLRESKKMPGGKEAYDEFMEDNEEGLRLLGKLKGTDARIKNLYAARARNEAKGNDEKVKGIEERIKKAQSDFNKKYNDIYLDKGVIGEFDLMP